MKVLHTADLHLKEGEEDRLGILKDLVQKAYEVKASVFIIAGDLFDSDKDAAILRSRVKSIFDQCRAPVIIIPGNHDPGSFGPDYDYGRNVMQAYKRPVTIFEIGLLKIAAIPYHEVDFTECVRDLPRNTDILVAHGTVYDALEPGRNLPILRAWAPAYPLHQRSIPEHACCVSRIACGAEHKMRYRESRGAGGH
jgi:exonuclease SbcD